MKEKIRFIDWIYRAVMLFWAGGILLPLFWVFYVSLKTNKEFFQSAWAFPKDPQWQNYKNAWENLNIGPALLNTLFVVASSLFIGIFISTLAAYFFTRMEWRGRKLIFGIVMLSLLLPGINALVPQYVVARSLHLTGSLSGLVFMYSVGLNVFDIMILGGFMKSIPKEMEESAYMDGASIMKIFIHIIIPMSVPGIITVAIFKFLSLYNDFLLPLIYLSDNAEKHTIGVAMYYANQKMLYQADWVQLFASVVISVVPTITAYIILQKQIVGGATLGAIKG